MKRSLLYIFIVAITLLPSVSLADGSASDSRASLKSSDSADRSIKNSPEKFEKASSAQQAIAAGHFARTRSLLIAALNEFDAGLSKADPSSLMDTGMFREGIKARARELDRVLDPQARDSETGARFSANPGLLKKR